MVWREGKIVSRGCDEEVTGLETCGVLDMGKQDAKGGEYASVSRKNT